MGNHLAGFRVADDMILSTFKEDHPRREQYGNRSSSQTAAVVRAGNYCGLRDDTAAAEARINGKRNVAHLKEILKDLHLTDKSDWCVRKRQK